MWSGENTHCVRQYPPWMKSSKVFLHRGITSMDITCATLTHYHLQQTGPYLHHAICTNESHTLVIIHLDLFPSPVIEDTRADWERPQCQDTGQAWAADNTPAQLSYVMSGNMSQTGPCWKRYQVVEVGRQGGGGVTQSVCVT